MTSELVCILQEAKAKMGSDVQEVYLGEPFMKHKDKSSRSRKGQTSDHNAGLHF